MFQSRTLLSFIEDKTGDIFFERSLEYKRLSHVFVRKRFIANFNLQYIS